MINTLGRVTTGHTVLLEHVSHQEISKWNPTLFNVIPESTYRPQDVYRANENESKVSNSFTFDGEVSLEKQYSYNIAQKSCPVNDNVVLLFQKNQERILN